MNDYQSWGRYPKATPTMVYPIRWIHDSIPFDTWSQSVLPYACGRSYGDSCLNDKGILLDTTGLNRFIKFDTSRGILRCESGTTLATILEITVPHGWFLPVTPGTKFVSLGGAIANDVHGKNHHRAGTLGCHVEAFELLRSTGERFLCTPTQNQDLFQATIGGLGLTGLIVWVEIKLKAITGPWMITERIRFSELDDFYSLSTESDHNFDYTVAWIDSLSGGRQLGRGSFIRANHYDGPDSAHRNFQPQKAIRIPCDMPDWLLHPTMMKGLNSLYFHSLEIHQELTIEPYDTFFYPLDYFLDWNRLYGKRGFLQYQCVIPHEHEQTGIRELLERIHRHKLGSFLAVLKRFGENASPGILSFPRPGTTLALDFPNQGEKTFQLLIELDEIVKETGGAVYPAKDARMGAGCFQTYFPRWRELRPYIDCKFSSTFWRRVSMPIANHETKIFNPYPSSTEHPNHDRAAQHIEQDISS